MGQKTHPLGFRLGITQEHRSIWYESFDRYADVLKEDDKIRTYLNHIPKSKGISNVRILRNGLNNKVSINIETGKPGLLVGDSGVDLKILVNDLKNVVSKNSKVAVTVHEIVNITLDAGLIADYVVKQLESRIAFRRAIREALKQTQKRNGRGIKIQVSGRLNGAEIARSEWIREGRVPLQTLRADIDYANREAHTIYGVLGIKVWVFKNEILTK